MKEYSLFTTIFFFLFIQNIYGQTKSFSSLNIDSLLTVEEAHEKVSLERAYCLDQIVRYYSNNSKFDSASIYVNEYSKISSELNNTDVAHRYLYRNAKLNYLKSNLRDLDTVAFSKAHSFFIVRDRILCPDISSQMVSYLENNTSDNGLTIAHWEILRAEDQSNRGDYENAARSYCRASLKLKDYGQYSRIENLFEKALINDEKTKNHKYKSDAYRILIETYALSGAAIKLEDLEKRLKHSEPKQLSQMYSIMMFHYEFEHNGNKHEALTGFTKWANKYDDIIEDPDHLKRWSERKVERIKQLQSAIDREEEENRNAAKIEQLKDSILINLPQGEYSYEVYNSLGQLTEERTLEINGTKITTGLKDNSYTITYFVHRSYTISTGIKLLSVREITRYPGDHHDTESEVEYHEEIEKATEAVEEAGEVVEEAVDVETEEEEGYWKFIVFHEHNGRMSINSEFYQENSKNNQEKYMLELLEEDEQRFQKKIEPRADEYYDKKTFKKLIKLPTLEEAAIPKIVDEFKQSFEPKLDNGFKVDKDFWYERFINFNAEFSHQFQEELLALKNFLILKGYQPFASMPRILDKEKTELPFKSREELVAIKMKQLNLPEKNDASLGLWFIERPDLTRLVKIEEGEITLWNFAFRRGLASTHFPQAAQDSAVYLITDQKGNSANLNSGGYYNIDAYLDEYRREILEDAEKMKVDGKYPERVQARLDVWFPVSIIKTEITEEGNLQIVQDSVNYYAISQENYFQLNSMEKIASVQVVREAKEKVRKELKLPSTEERLAALEKNPELGNIFRKDRKRNYLFAYSAWDYYHIYEMASQGYNPFKSLAKEYLSR